MKPDKLGLAALLAASIAAPIGAHAADLRFSTWAPPTHPLQPTGWEPWIQSIQEASEGRISVTLFPSEQLGSALDHYDIARDGIADLAYIAPGYQAGRFPVIALGQIPFLIANAKSGTRAFDAWYRNYADKEMGDIHFCMAYLHSPGTLHSKEPIAVPGDIDGKTVRPAGATIGQLVASLGGASVQVSAPAARDALEKGTADAITFPWGSLFLYGIDEVTPYHLDMPIYTTPFITGMNKAAYEALSDEDKAVMDAHCTSEWAEKVAFGWANFEDEGREKAIASPDHTLHEPTPEEVKAWQDAAAPLLDAWKADVTAKGYDADTVYQGLVDELKAAGALYE
ncbi:TRAP transporter substrate-binding protein [Cucumibacter marinus]|uniref:TRAP transporter substrate-binding protein n=1 Tax=Cucumibacter marinus TaxID=1121252 RepID=UPI00040A746C|nr:TRAP transporter substrate-binding protein [Cucumibacter marinus]